MYVPPSEMTTARIAACETDAAGRVGDRGAHLVVDLAPVSFLSSGGLGMFVKLSKRLHERGGALALARPQPAIDRILRMVGLESVLPTFPSVEAAARHLASPRPARVR